MAKSRTKKIASYDEQIAALQKKRTEELDKQKQEENFRKGKNHDIMPLRNFYRDLQSIFTSNAILSAIQWRCLSQ